MSEENIMLLSDTNEARISDLPVAGTINGTDNLELSQTTSDGLVSTKASVEALGLKMTNGIEYTSELQTTSKKVIGAINELNGKAITTDNIASQTVAVAGKVGTANKGSATQPVYIKAGVPTACTYELNKTVPADAVFTDTTYTSQSASSGSTAVSLCTRGEKYTWNNKANKAGSSSQDFACSTLKTQGHITTEDKANWLALRSDQGIACRNHDNSAFTSVDALAFNQRSSRRYKENIESMTEEYAKKILELRPVKYDYINKEDGVNRYGLIAEEVAEIETHPVSYRNGIAEGLDYSSFVPQLIKMIQIQQEEINELKALIKGGN